MTTRSADLRYSLRSVTDQIIGYCDVLTTQLGASSEALLAGLEDVHALAESIGTSLDTPRLNAKRVENLGRRVLALSSFIKHRSDDLTHFAADRGEAGLVPDLDRLRSAAESLLPIAHELTTNHEALATEPDLASAHPRPGDQAAASRPWIAATHAESRLLIVDDNESNRDLLARRLAKTGYPSTTHATNGREALELLRQHEFDLVLLDVMMPELDGVAVLTAMKEDARLRDVPVIMISAVDDVASVAQCIELGAEDYLPKPFDPVLLKARIRSSLERKRLRDLDKRHTIELEGALREIEHAHQVSEQLLHNILPSTVAQELREKNAVDPMYFEDATIVFTDFVGFTDSTERLSAEELVVVLNEYFSGIDRIIERYGMEKLKTIGDAYMYVGGLPVRNPAHPVDALLTAFAILDFVAELRGSGRGADWSIRIGMHTGPVIAGVVGVRKFAFDIWGESVNIASRLQTTGIPDRISISERTYSRVKDFFLCERRGKVMTKEGRELETYVPASIQEKLLTGPGNPPAAFGRRYRTYFGRELREFPASLRQVS